ncbi:hypothetical protein [Bacillus sp. UMB0728]|nr:hypothetical protein [Bacillus sp. UMB0728]
MKKIIIKIAVSTMLLAGVVGVVKTTTETTESAALVQPMLDPGQGTRPPG